MEGICSGLQRVGGGFSGGTVAGCLSGIGKSGSDLSLRRLCLWRRSLALGAVAYTFDSSGHRGHVVDVMVRSLFW